MKINNNYKNELKNIYSTLKIDRKYQSLVEKLEKNALFTRIMNHKNIVEQTISKLEFVEYMRLIIQAKTTIKGV